MFMKFILLIPPPGIAEVMGYIMHYFCRYLQKNDKRVQKSVRQKSDEFLLVKNLEGEIKYIMIEAILAVGMKS